MNEFELADAEFVERRTTYRKNAIARASARRKQLLREVAEIDKDLDAARTGNFLPLVEKFCSPQIAEEFE